MDTGYYTNKTVDRFIKLKLCQSDKKLYKYYINGDIKRFRKRLSKMPEACSNIEQVVYTCITDSLRDIIYKIINNLTIYMSPMGDLIVTGGEAFNTFFPRDNRIITSDIDTKFIPIFKETNGVLISPKSPKFFEYLQICKLIMWNRLGYIAKNLNYEVAERIELVTKSKIGKFLGIKLPNIGPFVTRRYTLINKMKQNENTTNITPNDILIDVELFALDLKVRYFCPKSGKITLHSMGGILDVALMRPFEIGYEVIKSRTQGHIVENQITGKMKYYNNIYIASKCFLIDDVYLMSTLGLRPLKKRKDHERLIMFAKHVLKINDITRSTNTHNIFKKIKSKLPKETKVDHRLRPVFSNKIKQYGMNVNPHTYTKYTTTPSVCKLSKRINVGLKGSPGLTIDKFNRTSGGYRYDIKQKKWIKNTTSLYIKNEMNYRPTECMNLSGSYPLYGYNPKRDSRMPVDLVRRSAIIPYIGLKM